VLFVGAIISIPITWYFMKGWLNNYAYRINLTALPFILSILILTTITTLLVGIQIAKASADNPIKNLRTE